MILDSWFRLAGVDDGNVFFLGVDEFLVNKLPLLGVGDGGDFGNGAKLVLFLDASEDPLVFVFFLERGEVHESKLQATRLQASGGDGRGTWSLRLAAN